MDDFQFSVYINPHLRTAKRKQETWETWSIRVDRWVTTDNSWLCELELIKRHHTWTFKPTIITKWHWNQCILRWMITWRNEFMRHVYHPLRHHIDKDKLTERDGPGKLWKETDNGEPWGTPGATTHFASAHAYTQTNTTTTSRDMPITRWTKQVEGHYRKWYHNVSTTRWLLLVSPINITVHVKCTDNFQVSEWKECECMSMWSNRQLESQYCVQGIGLVTEFRSGIMNGKRLRMNTPFDSAFVLQNQYISCARDSRRFS